MDGRYRLDSVLRETDCALVYRAVHEGIHRPVEVKLLRPELSPSGAEAARLLREARAAGSVAHRNVQSVVDSGADDHGRPFIVFEAIDGKTFDTLLASHPSGMLQPDAAKLMVQLLEGLSAVHKGGVVHRAIRPSSVVLVEVRGREPLVKLTRFDEAILQREGPPDEPPTEPVARDRDYLAPEVQAGVRASPGADVYAAGVLLRALLTGDSAVGVPLNDLAARAVSRATALRPEERFPDAQLLLEAVSLLTPTQEPHSELLTLKVSPATDPLEADLRYLKLRRETSAGIDRKPVGEGRVHLMLGLLVIESIYQEVGTEGWREIVDRVPEVDNLLPGSGNTEANRRLGVAVSVLSDLLAAADATKGRGDLAYVAQVGEKVAKRCFKRLMPSHGSIGSPEELVQVFPELWQAITRQGLPKVLEHRQGFATLSVRSQVEPSLELSALVAGVLRGLLRGRASLPTAGDVEVVACEALGDNATLFRVRY